LSLPFINFVRFLKEIEKVSSRKEIIKRTGDLLKQVSEEDIDFIAKTLGGKGFSGTLSLSWRGIFEALGRIFFITPSLEEKIIKESVDIGDAVEMIYREKKKIEPSCLSIRDIREKLKILEGLKGKGARKTKIAVLSQIFKNLGAEEAGVFAKVLVGETRTGISEKTVLLSISHAFNIPVEDVEKAWMFSGELGELLKIVKEDKKARITGLKPLLFSPLKPMLADTAQNTEEILKEMKDGFLIEYKYDGIRVQIHKDNKKIKLFSRNSEDITKEFEELKEVLLKGIKANQAILDSEVIAVDERGKPLAFQYLLKRMGARKENYPDVKIYIFDILYRDGELLTTLPLEKRIEILKETVVESLQAKRIKNPSRKEVEDFFKKAVEEKHEGIMVKSLASFYVPGRRGRHWLKLKKEIEADLVIIAAEWGYGRRHGWLSDYLLAARDKNGLVAVGKTFKGLTDKEFEELTQKLLSLKVKEVGKRVYVRPAIVVEVIFNEVQRSSKYPAGIALRFARIKRIRYDKTPNDISSVEELRRYSLNFYHKDPFKGLK